MGMINLGSVFKGITSGLGSIAKTALSAVAPKVTDMLKGVVGDLFSQGTKALQGVVGNIPLIGPLASKLLGMGGDKLSQLAQGGLEKLVQSLVEKITGRPVAGAPAGTPAVNLPALGTAAGVAARAASTAAATAAVNTVASQVTGQPAASGQSVEDQMGARAAALKEPAAPPEGATEGQMIEYQKNLQKYARMMDMLSKIIQAKNDMQKGIIGNFRV